MAARKSGQTYLSFAIFFLVVTFFGKLFMEEQFLSEEMAHKPVGDEMLRSRRRVEDYGSKRLKSQPLVPVKTGPSPALGPVEAPVSSEVFAASRAHSRDKIAPTSSSDHIPDNDFSSRSEAGVRNPVFHKDFVCLSEAGDKAIDSLDLRGVFISRIWASCNETDLFYTLRAVPADGNVAIVLATHSIAETREWIQSYNESLSHVPVCLFQMDGRHMTAKAKFETMHAVSFLPRVHSDAWTTKKRNLLLIWIDCNLSVAFSRETFQLTVSPRFEGVRRGRFVMGSQVPRMAGYACGAGDYIYYLTAACMYGDVRGVRAIATRVARFPHQDIVNDLMYQFCNETEKERVLNIVDIDLRADLRQRQKGVKAAFGPNTGYDLGVWLHVAMANPQYVPLWHPFDTIADAPETTNAKICVATFVGCGSRPGADTAKGCAYVGSVIRLLRSLQDEMKVVPASRVHFYVMQMKEKPLSVDASRQLERAGWSIRTVDRLAPVNVSGTRSVLRDAHTKLNVWSWDDCYLLYYLDADTLAFGDVSRAFTKQIRVGEIGVTRDISGKGVWEPGFNSGSFLIRPSAATFAEMLTARETLDFEPAQADQGFLNKFFEDKWIDIGFVYNAYQAAKMRQEEFWNMFAHNLVVVHYTMVKPWLENSCKNGKIDDICDYWRLPTKCTPVDREDWKLPSNVWCTDLTFCAESSPKNTAAVFVTSFLDRASDEEAVEEILRTLTALRSRTLTFVFADDASQLKLQEELSLLVEQRPVCIVPYSSSEKDELERFEILDQFARLQIPDTNDMVWIDYNISNSFNYKTFDLHVSDRFEDLREGRFVIPVMLGPIRPQYMCWKARSFPNWLSFATMKTDAAGAREIYSLLREEKVTETGSSDSDSSASTQTRVLGMFCRDENYQNHSFVLEFVALDAFEQHAGDSLLIPEYGKLGVRKDEWFHLALARPQIFPVWYPFFHLEDLRVCVATLVICSEKADESEVECDYVKGAARLGNSIRSNMRMTRPKLIALQMEGKELKPESRNIVESSGWEIHTVPRLAPPFGDRSVFWRFRDAFTKLHVFNMTEECDRGLFLDSDTMMVRDVSPVFTRHLSSERQFAATRDYMGAEAMDRFNSGSFLFQTSKEMYQQLLALQQDTSVRYETTSGDQGFLNHVFANSWSEIGLIYNVNMQVYQYKKTLWNRIKPNVRVMHYTEVKPWGSEISKTRQSVVSLFQEWDRLEAQDKAGKTANCVHTPLEPRENTHQNFTTLYAADIERELKKTISSLPRGHDTHPLTLVTMMMVFDQKAKYPEGKYLEWAGYYFTHLCHLPIVVLVNSDHWAETVRKLRVADDPRCKTQLDTYNMTEPITTIVHVNISSFRVVEDYGMEEWTDCQPRRDPESFRHSPHLYMVWNEKAFALATVANLDPFKSKYFLWLDMGSMRKVLRVNPLDPYRFPSLPKLDNSSHDGSLMLLWGVPGTRYTYANAPFTVAGTIFGGSQASVFRWTSEFSRDLHSCIIANRFCGKDQDIMYDTIVRTQSNPFGSRPDDPDPNDWLTVLQQPTRQYFGFYYSLAE